MQIFLFIELIFVMVKDTYLLIPPVVFIDEENITCVVVENKINSRRCNK